VSSNQTGNKFFTETVIPLPVFVEVNFDRNKLSVVGARSLLRLCSDTCW